MAFVLKHNDGVTHLNDYWLDDEFSVREWETLEEAQKFADRQNEGCFRLVVEEVKS